MLKTRSILHVRDDSSTTTMSNSMVDLLIALMILVFIGLCLTGALYVVRKLRRNRAVARQQLPLHNEAPRSHHRRLTITATPYGGRGSTIHVYDEKSSMMDSDRHKKSGRVVVVRVGETGVGLEPLKEQDQLPAYEKETGGTRFQSIDMDRIGGLKEKESWS
ncbi:hypothetical protein H4I96_02274 [Botrytis cinerea]